MTQTTNEFLEFVLSAHKHDSKTDSYTKEVERVLTLGLSQKEITRRLINEANDRVQIDTPDWDRVSAKTLLNSLYETAAYERGHNPKQKYGSFYELVVKLVNMGLYEPKLLEWYTREEIERIGSFIDPEKDHLFNFVGLNMLAKRYLAKDHTDTVLELPQERWLIIAMYVMSIEGDKKLEYIYEAYWALSNLYMTVATPTLANSGKTHGQLSSCFIDTVDDSLDEINFSNFDTARVSKNGGGVGLYFGKVRALGSSIRQFKNKASGVIPWIQNTNGIAVSVDQLGQRQGAVSVYLDAWHKDVFDFLQIGTNNGDPRRKAYDVFPGLCIPDLFMELSDSDETGRMKTPDAEWHLFDPYEIEQLLGFRLEDSYDEEDGSGTWRQRYQQCVDHPLLSRKTIPVKQLVAAILTAQLETGHPYMFYRDEVNRKNPNKHEGMIYCSNLCTEIAQNMSPTRLVEERREGNRIIMEREIGDYVVCNLSSINLGKAVPARVLKRLIPIQVRMLDNVITVNNLPLIQAQATNEKYRAVGLGTFGWHHLLAVSKIDWNSLESVALAEEVYEEIAYLTIKASADLAREKGSYPTFEGSDWNTGEFFRIRELKSSDSRFDWDALAEYAKGGMRNGYLQAVAPNTSTGLIADSTQGIDPFYGADGTYIEEKKDFKTRVVAPEMSTDTFMYYYKKNAHNLNHNFTILQNAKRQRYVDQAISFNLYVRSDIKGKDLMEMHRKVWRNKIKTSYYVRGTANEAGDDCEACQ